MNGWIKRYVTSIFATLVCGFSAAASPAALYQNTGYITNAPVINALTFINSGEFEPVIALSNISHGENLDVEAQTPFATQSTHNYTNTGVMIGQPGFLFDLGTTTARTNANWFYNVGQITAVDTQTPPDVVSYSGSPFEYQPGTGLAYPSQIFIHATNIYNGPNGYIAVGENGLLEMHGKNITNYNSALVAGDLTGNDPYDEAAIFQEPFTFQPNSTAQYFTAPGTFFDLWWGDNVAGTMNLTKTLTGGETPIETVDVRGFVQYANNSRLALPFTGPGFAFSTNAISITNITGTNIFAALNQFQSFIYTYTTDGGTNVYYNIVCVNTNFSDTNISVNVSFASNVVGAYFSDLLGSSNQFPDPSGVEDIVQFSEACYDVINQQAASNSVYLLDGGALFSNTVTMYTNTVSLNDYARPSYIEVTTSTPEELDFASPTNTAMDFGTLEELFYPGVTNQYTSKSVSYTSASYAVQVGWNTEGLGGPFNDTQELIALNLDIGDATQEPGRIDIEGTNVDMTGARIRAEGLVTLVASNLIGGGMTGVDWGTANATLGSASGSLLVSNFFPTNFLRVRGDLALWSANWISTGTNAFATNNYIFHMLVVNQDMRGSFQPTVRNLNLNAKKTVNIQDPLDVINQTLITSSNLVINSQVQMTQNADTFVDTNVPFLQNLLINTNGILEVDNTIDLGLDLSKILASPAKRKYTIASITNFGLIEASSTLFQVRNFENDGGIEALNGGSLTLAANTLNCGLVLTNQTNLVNASAGLSNINFMVANGNITISAESMGFSNTYLIAGYANNTTSNATPLGGTLDLETTANGQIADFVSGAPGTNQPLVNFWQVTDGFSLPVKPATGDLFGTEIDTIATNFTVALHTWAGVDMGPVYQGFADNMVIGHLKLSRQSQNAILHFTGAGAQNGMYVDYLELDSNSLSYSDYRDGLVIDPNLTIYFAACNVNPAKLTNVYPGRLVWVSSFVGPNSAVAVPFYNSNGAPTNFCLMNTNVAFSPDIAFFDGTPNIDNQPYVLNNPTNLADVLPCPTPVTLLRALSAATTQQEFNFQNGSGTNVNIVISSIGQGTISPKLTESQVAMGKKLSLTATPANGWVFSGWTTSGLPGNSNVAGRTINFTVANDLVLTANFTPKTYTLVQGTYFGLFTNNPVAADNSGWFTFTLGGSGAISGRLLMGPSIYTFNSTFPATGPAQFTARHGSSSLDVDLVLNLANPNGQVTGTVSGEGSWTSPLLGNIESGWSKKNSSPFAGQYTMILTNMHTNALAIGDSYGSITVSKEGVLSVAGELADFDGFSQSVPLATNGLWPFYSYSANGKDLLLGWITFQASMTGSPTITGTNIFWSKAASSKSAYYPMGFNSAFGVVASAYSSPGKDSPALNLVDPVVLLLGGSAATSTNDVTFDGKATYTGDDLSLTINPKTGIFSGKLDTGAGGPPSKLNGVVLQGQQGGFGFFPGTNETTGTVLLQSQ